MKLVLASSSPRRKELLKYISNDFIVSVSQVNEIYDKNLLPHEIVLTLSKQKAEAVSKDYPNHIVIGSDTVVSIKGKVLEKPINDSHAFEMLRMLSNQTHQVVTGVTIIQNNQIDSFYSITDVTFYELTDQEIIEYIKTKEPFDKAGAYGIQGYASKFVKKINGDYFTVMGLPVGELYQRLKKL